MPEEAFRTEPATPRRRQEARRRGQIAKSVEINSALLLIGILLLIKLLAPYLFSRIFIFTKSVYENAHTVELTFSNVNNYFITASLFLLKLIGPIFVVALIIGIVANVIQFGFLLSIHPLAPSFHRINPIAGIARLISRRALFELLKGLLKVAIVGYVSYLIIKAEFHNFVPMMQQGVVQSAIYTAIVAFKIAIWIAIILIVLAILDYVYQRYEYEKSLMMTKQEVKEEYKQLEGDPFVRARIRQRQRELARRRMFLEVPRADVVITNPVFIAVALRYDANVMRAPQVIAKGMRKIAERIREIAIENNIPIVENPPLAQALYKSCEIGDEIPPQLYRAVAEVLAYVYSLRQKKAV